MYKAFFKPLLDRILSLILLVLVLPIFVIILLLLLIVNRGRVFFYQKRPGLKGRPFTLIKFKTMTDKRDIKGNLLPDYLRFTPIGRLLRKTSLDEISQILNVLKGICLSLGLGLYGLNI